MTQTQFYEESPSLESYWRAVILFGRNVASYKFALAKSLIDLAQTERTTVTYEELSVPFARHITQHLKLADKQCTSSSSKFLDTCRKFNANEISHDTLIATTKKLGFVNVIDAFHIVNNKEIPIRFFSEHVDQKGIDLTDQIHLLKQLPQFANLPDEVEARWRLVETAWQLNISRSLITVAHDEDNNVLYTHDKWLGRVDVTSSRSALNGYQKGKCFYCFTDLSLETDAGSVVDVDHFFPHLLKGHGLAQLDGVWNLVLSCYDCNRGPNGKFARVPELRFLERLHSRNEYLINSHHPLRETLMRQIGSTEAERNKVLQRYYNEALALLIHKWQPTAEHPGSF